MQYVNFPLGAEQAGLVKEGGTALRLVADHPAYRTQVVLSEEARREIASDVD